MVEWTGNGPDTNWDDPLNWSGGAVPTAGSDVTINSGTPATITIQSGDVESVDSLTTAAGYDLAITGGSLAIANTSVLAGNLSLSGEALNVASGATVTLAGAASSWTGGNVAGSFAGSGSGTVSLPSGTLTIGSGGATFNFPAGVFQWTGGQINTDGNTLTNTGVMTLANSSDVYLGGGGTLANQGTIDETGTGNLDLGSAYNQNTTLDNQLGATFAFQSDAGISYSFSTPGTFSNEGTLSKSGGTGTSTMQVISFSNSGSVAADSGTLALSCGAVDIGSACSYSVAAGAALDLAGGTFSGDFSFTVAQGAAVDLTGGDYQGTFTGSGGGTVLVNSSSNLTILGATTFAFPAGLFQWTGGQINTDGNTLTNTGVMTLANSSDVYLGGGGTLANQGTIDETGTGNLDLGSAYNQNTTLDNQLGATFAFQSDAGISYSFSTPGTFSNEGTLSKSGGTGTSTMQVISFSNSGSVAADSGTLALSCGAVDIGSACSYSVAAGAALDLAGGTFSGDFSFTVAQGAAVDLTGGDYQGTFTGSGGGTVLVNSSSNLTILGATTFAFPAGLFQWTGGQINTAGNTLTNTGVLTLANSSDVHLYGGGTLANQGTIDETGTGNLDLGGTYTQDTTLDNQLGATFAFQSDAGISYYGPSGVFSNQGTLSKSGGAGTSTIQAISFSNSGSVEVDSGTLASSCGATSIGSACSYSVAAGAALDLAGGTFSGDFSFTVAQGAAVDLTGGDYQGTFTGSGGGTVLVNSSSNLTILGATTFAFPAGLFQWTGGQIDIGGNILTNTRVMNLTLANSSDVHLYGGGTLANQGTIDETGTGNLDLGGTYTQDTTLDNQLGATFAFQSDAGISYYGPSGVFSNQGTLSKTGGAGTSTIQAISFSNSGTIDVATGTLSVAVTQGTSSGGTFHAANGATLDLGGGSYSGSYIGSGGGIVTLSSATLTIGAGGANLRPPRRPVPVDRRHDQHQRQHTDERGRHDPLWQQQPVSHRRW